MVSPQVRIKHNGVDISNHIIYCEKVPIIQRNRDWSPIFAGFDMQVSWGYLGQFAVNDVIEVLVNEEPVYLGYVKTRKRLYDSRCNRVTVYHKVVKLDDLMNQYPTLNTALYNTADFQSGKVFTVPNINADYIVSPAHGFPSPPTRVQFKSVGGQLPAPLQPNQYYYVIWWSDDRLLVYEDYYQAVSGDPMRFTTLGTGTNYLAAADATKCNDLDNESCPNVRIDWLIRCVMSLIEVTIDSSEIDNIVLHQAQISGTTYSYTWKDMLLDVNMLYCLNQESALRHESVDTSGDCQGRKISLAELVRFIFGWLGVNLRYVGNNTYKLYMQARDQYGNPLQRDQPVYNIPDDELLGIDEDLEEAEPGGCFFYGREAARSKYSTYGTKEEIKEYDREYYGQAKTQLECYSNFKVLLRDKTTLNSANVLSTAYYPLFRVMFNYVSAKTKGFNIRRVTCPYRNTLFTVTEHNLNVENLRSEILMEMIR